MALQIREDGTVVVRAPLFVREREIRQFVERHLDWIEKHQKKQAESAAMQSEIKPLSETQLAELKRTAKADLSARTENYASKIGVNYGRISIRHQKSKWGSCSSEGNLNYNCLLMLAPESVRDYVVVHELCHRKQMNHSTAFWTEVERILPDYKESRKWLKTHGQELMRYNTER